MLRQIPTAKPEQQQAVRPEQPVQAHTPLHENPSFVPDSPAPVQKTLVPKRAMFFDNDLTEDEKEGLIDTLVQSARAALAEDKVSVNTVARLLAIEHNKARAGLDLSASLKGFLQMRKESGTLAKAKRAMAKLSAEERALLLQQLAGVNQSGAQR